MAEKPNLIFILPDRMRRDAMTAYGSEWIESPHLDQLAADSFVFERAYVTQPVCAPSRASLLTGLYPQASGVRVNGDDLPVDVPVITEMLPEGYRTGYFGKWHLGDDFTRQRGFDEWVSVKAWMVKWTNEENALTRSDYYSYLSDRGLSPSEEVRRNRLRANAHRAALDAEHQMAPYLGDRAAEFIEAGDNRPFVLFVSCVEPHPPFDGPYNDLYDPDEIPDGESYLRAPHNSSPINEMLGEFFPHSERDGFDLAEESEWRRLRANYYGNVRLVDDMVGKILGALERSGKADKTVIVFTSEHGEMLGSHALMELRRPYEETAGVPLLVRVPWLGADDISGNFGQIDLLPTLLDLLGEVIPGGLHGISRADVLAGEGTLDGNDIFIQHNGVGDRDLAGEGSSHTWPADKVRELNSMGARPWRSIISSDRWKLTLYEGMGGELYDLTGDPAEMKNLIADPAHHDRIAELTFRLRAWQESIGDDAVL